MIEFIQRSGIVTAMVGLLTALPKTKLYKKLYKEGRILNKASGNNTDSTLNFIPFINKEIILEGYKNVLETIYNPKNYYNRIIVYLNEYRELAKGSRLSTSVLFKAFSKAIWKLGINGKGKFYFWKMVFWTLFHKPALISEAITQSVYGYHYRTVLLSTRH